MDRKRMLFIPIQTLPSSMHVASGKRLLMLYANQTMQYYSGPTPNKSPIEFKDTSSGSF